MADEAPILASRLRQPADDLPMLVLVSLSDYDRSAPAIADWIGAKLDFPLTIREPMLRQTLRRLEENGQIRGVWEMATPGDARKFFRLTDSGRATLNRQISAWRVYASAIEQAIDPDRDVAPPDS